MEPVAEEKRRGASSPGRERIMAAKEFSGKTRGRRRKPSVFFMQNENL